jgi:hypothetical protein
MLRGGSGWSLPSASLDQELWSADVRKINAALGEALAAPVTSLRYVRFQPDDAARRTEAVYVIENHSMVWHPPGGAAWIGRAALADLAPAQPDQRALIDAVLAEAESGQIPDLREPWARPGWFVAAAAWTESELLRLGYTLTAPVEQVKSWGISCILRGHTTGGAVYFKVASSRPLFVHEPRLTRRLSELYPGQVPAPLATDDSRRWMLLADVGPAVGWDAPVEVQEEMLLAFGALQRGAVARIDDLWACGCLDRRLDRLATQIDPLLADTATLAGQTDAAEMAALHVLAPRLKEMCAELASHAVPHTLVHGDLHLGNVARPAGRYLFFDWTDACVAHPFFDTISIFQTDDPSREARLRDAYLRLWLDYEPMERLLEAWALAKPLAALHQAVSYQHIVNSLEPIRRSENFSGLPYWLRKVLQWCAAA